MTTGMTATPESLFETATSIADGGLDAEASARLIEEAGRDRQLLEETRDLAAAQVRAKVDDWKATAALRLLNRALAELPRSDPLDWQVRWQKRRKP